MLVTPHDFFYWPQCDVTMMARIEVSQNALSEGDGLPSAKGALFQGGEKLHFIQIPSGKLT